MTAREYLTQLRAIDLRIKKMREEAAALREMLTGGGISYDKDQVLSSPTNAQEIRLVRLLDLEKQISREIDAYSSKRASIIQQISQLDDIRFVTILTYRYVPDERGRVKTLVQIARIMGYNYDYVRRMHGRALQAFQKNKSQKVTF